MFGKKKQNHKNDPLFIKNENYKMGESYKTDNLVVANLEYVTSKSTINGPVVKTTMQKYIFEIINDQGKTKYREVFTGLIIDSSATQHQIDLPYVTNVFFLKDLIPTVMDDISKYGLLLVLNIVNTKTLSKKYRKHMY